MEELRKQLAEAIEHRDSYGCSLIACEMLKALEPHDALQIALEQANRYLPAFEKLYPAEIWVRQWLEVASRFEPLEQALLRSRHSFYHPPGDDDASRAYLSGLAELDIGFERYFQQRPEVVLAAAGDAIGYIAAAKFSTYLWETAPATMLKYQEVQRSHTEPMSEEQSRIMMNFRGSSERQYFIEKYWNEIADEIASKIAE